MILSMNIMHSQTTASLLNQVLTQRYGIHGAITRLAGEYDENYQVTTHTQQHYLLKVSAAPAAIIQIQDAVLLYLQEAQQTFQTPTLLPTLSGEYHCAFPSTAHTVRLLSWLPGTLLGKVKYHTKALLNSFGQQVGALTRALSGFQHPAAKRQSKWDLQQATWIAEHLNAIQQLDGRACVAACIERFIQETAATLPTLRQSIIHGDLNDYNILVTGELGKERVTGFIDFGDVIETATINELAIAAAYGLLNKPDPLMAVAEIIRGFHAIFPLQALELEHLFNLITMRLCVSVVNSALRKQAQPHEDYLTISEQPAWQALHLLSKIQPSFALYVFRDACGLPPCPQTKAITDWLSDYAASIAPMFDVNLQTAKKTIYNLSPSGVDNVLQQHANTITVGRYNEARCIYTSEAYHEVVNHGSEARTIHLGIDIGLPAGDAVYAPLDATIHSIQDNNTNQDYGPTIILEHRIAEKNIVFYTLYGHLSRASLTLWQAGQYIQRGTQLGEIGTQAENGGWAPHLHLQIITDLLGEVGTFPGVARASQRNIWLSLCPDPNLLLQLSELRANATLSTAALLTARTQLTGSNLKLSYDEPLHIVRGRQQYLFDATGAQYLDCVNNVSHVGHCHPAIVQAASQQLSQLNTNTRYLHENLIAFAKRLIATMPDSLSVCYFVNSGSEANELALRLAHAYTKKKNIVVLDHAYHGNTANLIAISPYKVNQSGQHHTPEHVSVLPLPDQLRQQHLTPNVEKFSQDTAAFICEALPSCAGQIELPAGYLQTVYQAASKVGAVCIADEVQTGLGRLGSHFWGFATQAVVPDIVTLGKPLGNGFPLGAVITTRAIADVFAAEMEYFNTFGGNPVACAVGNAVLAVIEEEGLQPHAWQVGQYLKTRLQALAAKYEFISEVRGRGLYLGIELSHAALAAFVCNRMRERGILLGVDGPRHNVIKIKPPLAFTEENANTLVDQLEQVFSFAV